MSLHKSILLLALLICCAACGGSSVSGKQAAVEELERKASEARARAAANPQDPQAQEESQKASADLERAKTELEEAKQEQAGKSKQEAGGGAPAAAPESGQSGPCSGVDGADYDSFNDIYYALPRGKSPTQVAECLLHRGMDVNASAGEAGYTPLCWAGMRGNSSMVKWLLDNGARAHAPCNLLKPSSRYTIHAVSSGGIDAADGKEMAEALDLIISAGADVNQRTESGWSPLHQAAYFGYMEMARALVARGADIRAATSTGRTAISLAEQEGHNKIASWLRSQLPSSGPRSHNPHSAGF